MVFRLSFILLITSLLCGITVSSFAVTSSQYTIFIDAGSTGSRLHIFQYNTTSAIPVINDVFSNSSKPGLSSYANDPKSASSSLKKLLDDADQFLQTNNVDPHNVPINILATGGMRLLPKDKQQEIYVAIRQELHANYAYPMQTLKTISGKMEGFYGWLDVNYLLKNFQNNQPTVGSIDMGGASTQIAFALDNRSISDENITVTINNQLYTVFSKSLLGLGQDETLKIMTTDAIASSCYPQNYQFKPGEVGNFDLKLCGNIYQNIIKKSLGEEAVTPDQNQSFVGYSGIYYTFNFLNTDNTPKQSSLEDRIKTVCYRSWEQLQKDYPNLAEKYLAGYCANAVYYDQLLYSTYKIPDNHLIVTNQIDKKDIDWTLGAVLYSVMH